MKPPPTHAPARATDLADAAAERRRAALKRLMDQHGIRPAELARRAGLSTPNALYNFLNRRSFALSVVTLEKIIAVFPDGEASELIDRRSPPSGTAAPPTQLRSRAVPIVGRAVAGLFQPASTLPDAERATILVPAELIGQRTDAIAVRVSRPGAERLYPAGTVLICQALPARRIFFEHGEHLIVQRHTPEGIETTVRRVRLIENVVWLWLESTDPAHQQPLPAPWDAARHGLDVRIVARVLASWQPSEDLLDL